MYSAAVQWLRRRGVAIAFAVVYLWCFPWFPQIRSANELPRAYLTMAIAREGRFAIDSGVDAWGTTADVSPSGGHQYSNKAPGSSFLAVPGYLLLEGGHAIVGGEPSLAETIWMSRFTTGVIPSLWLLWLLWGFLGRWVDDGAKRPVLVGLGVGSMFFLYSTLFISHPLSAVCIGAAWIYALEACEQGRRGVAASAERERSPAGATPAPAEIRYGFAWAGFFAGAAPLVDYQAAFAAVPVMIWVLVQLARWPRREALRAIGIATLGAIVPIAALLLYHWACFGSPLRTGYAASETFAYHHQQGFLGLDKLRWEAFVGSTVAPDNGLLALWPMAALAIPGWVVMFRKRDPQAWVTLAVAVIYMLFISGINFWRGGWQVGPRYITAMLPFLAPPIAIAIEAASARWWLRGAAVGVCLVGLVSYGLTAALYPYFPDTHFVSPVREITLRLLVDGHVPWNLGWLIGLRGIPSLLPFLAAMIGLAAWAAWPTSGPRRAASCAIAFGVCAVLVAGYFAFGTGGAAADHSYANLVATMPT